MGFGSVNVGFSPEENVPGGVVVLGSDGKIPGALIPSGYATLGSDGKLAESQRWEIDAYTKEEADQKIEAAVGQMDSGIPVGNIGWFAGSTPPDGYLACNGAAVSRASYAALFAVIGTTYGGGNGSTTFTLPDLRDRVAWGGTSVGTKKEAGLPNISGELQIKFNNAEPIAWDAFSIYTERPGSFWSPAAEVEGDSASDTQLRFDASESNSIYGASTTVQPPALVLLPCIKY